ncbi:hypothetical protein TWF718_009020 [Orbilia javanica]|uniref:BTB domain-containing protein n=1 Tax=Orbilia javanica TaxID=47235 RepID=A0AAN8MZ04_9PEZI
MTNASASSPFSHHGLQQISNYPILNSLALHGRHHYPYPHPLARLYMNIDSLSNFTRPSHIQITKRELLEATVMAASNSKAVVLRKDEDSMPRHIGSILDSEVIRVMVGQDKQVLYVHRAILEKSDSHTLKQVVSGKFKEGRGENGLDWSSEDPETVRRFLTYLYSGDYHVPKPELKKSTIEPQNGVESGSGAAPPAAATDHGKKPRNEPDEQSVDQSGGVARPLTPIQYHLETVRLPTWRYNTDAGDLEHTPRIGKEFAFGDTMLAHARLYVFAQYHLLRPLETLALQRLTQVMVLAENHSYNLEADVIPIIEYTYHDEELERPEDLRELVSQFVAIHFHRFEGEDIYDILEAGGTFVRDVCSKIGRQLLANELKSGGGRGRLTAKAYGRNAGKPGRAHQAGNYRLPSNIRPSALPENIAQWYGIMDNLNGW